MLRPQGRYRNDPHLTMGHQALHMGLNAGILHPSNPVRVTLSNRLLTLIILHVEDFPPCSSSRAIDVFRHCVLCFV